MEPSIIGAVIGAVAALVAAAIGVIRWGDLISKKCFEIVDMSYKTGNAESEIDIKVRNPTDQIVYIKAVLLSVERVWEFTPAWAQYAYHFSSATYDINVPIKAPPYKVKYSLSQSVSPNCVDRFSLRLKIDSNSEGVNSRHDYILMLKTALVINAESKTLPGASVLLGLANPSHFYSGSTGMNLGGVYDTKMKSAHERLRKLVKGFQRKDSQCQRAFFEFCVSQSECNRKFLKELRGYSGLKDPIASSLITRITWATRTFRAANRVRGLTKP